MRKLPVIALLLALILSLWSCREERHSFVPNVEGEKIPTMTTYDVSTFISDSGYTRYHITTDLWQMFEDAAEPFWKFPTGLFLQQYDLLQKPSASVVCDSATYFSRKRLWQLDGHVVMVNTLRDSFITQQLFWDQTKQKIYSDSFIHIVRSDRIIEGYGFVSNQNMTAYTVNRPTGIIPVERPEAKEQAAANPADTAFSDSLAPQPARRPTHTRASQRNQGYAGFPGLMPANTGDNNSTLKPRPVEQ